MPNTVLGASETMSNPLQVRMECTCTCCPPGKETGSVTSPTCSRHSLLSGSPRVQPHSFLLQHQLSSSWPRRCLLTSLAWQGGRVSRLPRALSWLLSQPVHCSNHCLLRWCESPGSRASEVWGRGEMAGRAGAEGEEDLQGDVR